MFNEQDDGAETKGHFLMNRESNTDPLAFQRNVRTTTLLNQGSLKCVVRTQPRAICGTDEKLLVKFDVILALYVKS